MRISVLRRNASIDLDFQFLVVGALVFLVTVEGFLVGWAFHKAELVSGQLERPDSTFAFLKYTALALIPVIALNVAIGTWVARKVSRPLNRMRDVMAELARGNLEAEVAVHQNDLLQECSRDLNHLADTLRRLIYRDRSYALEVNEVLTKCEHLAGHDRQKLEHLILEAKSRISVINAHFMKGKDQP